MKKTKKKFLIILLVVLLLGLAVGYAAFSDVLTITGTANAGGTFDMQFTSCTVTNAQGVKTTHTAQDDSDDITEGIISNDGDLLTLKCVDLSYPGAGAQYNIVITNVGTIPAKVNGLSNQTNVTGNGVILIDGLTLPGNHSATIAPGGTCTFSVTVKWDPTHTQPLTDAQKTVSFGLDINYEQDTTNFTGTATHGV